MPYQPNGSLDKLTAFLDENLDHFAWSLDAICKKDRDKSDAIAPNN